MASKGLKRFREAGLTKVQPNGNEQFYIQDNEPDPEGKRVYCVVANNMSLNELVPLTKQEYLMLKLAKGDQYTFEDWTETFNIQPKDLQILEDQPLYGVDTSQKHDYQSLMQYDTSEHID